MIDNRFLFFDNRDAFDDARESISDKSIAFVADEDKDDKFIYTHEVKFDCNDNSNKVTEIETDVQELQQAVDSLGDALETRIDDSVQQFKDDYINRFYYQKTDVDNKLATKQDKLVPGNNIKTLTIDGGDPISLIGSGNININTDRLVTIQGCTVSLTNQTMFAQVKDGKIDSFVRDCSIQVFDNSGELIVDNPDHGFTFSIGEIVRSDGEPALRDNIHVDKNLNKVSVSITDLEVPDEPFYITIRVNVSAAATTRAYDITIYAVKDGADGKDVTRLALSSYIIHCDAYATKCLPNAIKVGAYIGEQYYNVSSLMQKGYTLVYSYDNDQEPHILKTNVLRPDKGTYSDKHEILTVSLYKDVECYDTALIHYIYDGESIEGAASVNYYIGVVRNDITVQQDDSVSGSIGFKVYKSTGTSIEEITELSTAYEGEEQNIYVEVGENHVIAQYDNDLGYWKHENGRFGTCQKKYTLIQFKISGNVVASTVVPFIIPGKDGQDAAPESLIGAATRIWSNYDENATYYDGTTGEDGVKYLDIVRMPDGNYYRLRTGVGSVSATNYEAADDSGFIWIKFTKQPDSWIQNLIASNIAATNITAHQVVVTRTSDDTVTAGIIGGQLPAELDNAGVTNNYNVRIFAGDVIANGDISSTAFNVKSNGVVSACGGKVVLNANGSGYIANGALSWDENGNIQEDTAAVRAVGDFEDLDVSTNNIIVDDAVADFRNANPEKWIYNIAGHIYKAGRLVSSFSTAINLYNILLMCNYWVNYYSNVEANPSIADVLLQAVISNIEDVYLNNKSRFNAGDKISIDFPIVQVAFGSEMPNRFVSRDDIAEYIIDKFNLQDEIEATPSRSSMMAIPTKRPLLIYYTDSQNQPANPNANNTEGWYEGRNESQQGPTNAVWKRYVKDPTYVTYRVLDVANNTYGDWYTYSLVTGNYDTVTPGDDYIDENQQQVIKQGFSVASSRKNRSHNYDILAQQGTVGNLYENERAVINREIVSRP